MGGGNIPRRDSAWPRQKRAFLLAIATTLQSIRSESTLWRIDFEQMVLMLGLISTQSPTRVGSFGCGTKLTKPVGSYWCLPKPTKDGLKAARRKTRALVQRSKGSL